MHVATWLWHKELAGAEGKMFDAKSVDLKQLEEQGWVDSPEKIGINVNTGLGGQPHPVQEAYESGRIRGIDLDSSGMGHTLSSSEVEDLLAENRRLRQEHERFTRREESASEKARLAGERAIDEAITAANNLGVRYKKTGKNVSALENGEDTDSSDSTVSGTVTASPDPGVSDSGSDMVINKAGRRRPRAKAKKPVLKSDLEATASSDPTVAETVPVPETKTGAPDPVSAVGGDKKNDPDNF